MCCCYALAPGAVSDCGAPGACTPVIASRNHALADNGGYAVSNLQPLDAFGLSRSVRRVTAIAQNRLSLSQ